MKNKDIKMLEEAYGQIRNSLEMSIFDELSPDEIDFLKSVVRGDEELDSNPELFEKLFDHFVEEMPYSTAKGRTGDPYQWIEDKLYQLIGNKEKDDIDI